MSTSEQAEAKVTSIQTDHPVRRPLEPVHLWQAKCFALEREITQLRARLNSLEQEKLIRTLVQHYGLQGTIRVDIEAGVIITEPSEGRHS